MRFPRVFILMGTSDAFLASPKAPAQERTAFAQQLNYGHNWETERRFEGRKC